jgi:hypothetical protein
MAGTDLVMKVTKSILDGTRPEKRLKTLTGGDEMEATLEKAMIVQVPGVRDGAYARQACLAASLGAAGLLGS